MELERYQALLCALDRQSLSAAADELGYTPSGISRMMAALESEVGFPLLRRSRKGIVPTPECESLLPVIRQWVHFGEGLRQSAASIRHVEVGTLTLGSAYSAYYGWLARLAADFCSEHPSVQIRFVNGYSSQLAGQLRAHQADLAVISRREGLPVWLPLRRDPLVAMVPPQSPLAALERLPVQTFAQQPYIDTYHGADVDNARYFRRCGVQPNTQYTAMDINATLAMVKAGLGLGLVNRLIAEDWDDSVRLLPLDPPEEIEIGMAAGDAPTPAARAFAAFVRRRLDGQGN